MNKKTKSVIAWIVLIFFLFIMLYGAFEPAFADSNSDIESAREAQRQAKEKIAEIKNKKSNALEVKSKIDSEINLLTSKIDSINAKISESNAKISKKEEELNAANESVKKQDENLKLRLRTLYEEGLSSYLEILLNSESFGDFLSRYNIIEEVLEYDNKVLTQKKDYALKIEQLKQELEDEKQVQVASKGQLTAEQSKLAQKLQTQKSLINELENDQEANEKLLKEAEAEERRVLAEIAAQQKNSGTTPAYTGAYIWPTPGCSYVTSYFGNRFHPTLKRYKLHTGIDIGASYGSSILATASGTVVTSGWNNAYGNYVVINHGGSVSSLYGHASKLLVSAGQTVTAGQQIALVGSTGYSTGPHLHFEIIVNGQYQNPLNYVSP